jgi:hypothetical protein
MDTDETQIFYPQIAPIFADWTSFKLICVNLRNLRIFLSVFNLCFICG